MTAAGSAGTSGCPPPLRDLLRTDQPGGRTGATLRINGLVAGRADLVPQSRQRSVYACRTQACSGYLFLARGKEWEDAEQEIVRRRERGKENLPNHRYPYSRNKVNGRFNVRSTSRSSTKCNPASSTASPWTGRFPLRASFFLLRRVSSFTETPSSHP